MAARVCSLLLLLPAVSSAFLLEAPLHSKRRGALRCPSASSAGVSCLEAKTKTADRERKSKSKPAQGPRETSVFKGETIAPENKFGRSRVRLTKEEKIQRKLDKTRKRVIKEQGKTGGAEAVRDVQAKDLASDQKEKLEFEDLTMREDAIEKFSKIKGQYAGSVPEEVSDRMLARIVRFAPLPLIFGLLLFPLNSYLLEEWDFGLESIPLAWLTQFCFVVGLLGIPYGIISASWEPEVEGSALGWEEFQENTMGIAEAFSRQQKDSKIRRTMESRKKDREAVDETLRLLEEAEEEKKQAAPQSLL
uniref:Uncharacterized protein n=1 Tax=Chromera velia CCMP2878 TaxID=1169474 RepID=A0A0G4HA12_9ALVE|mmetsp:Transcript_17645/g.35804  ORF Transcript_17645/g.35804 Transcript_17645/m.35804 type:complete len:305 (-) Transcript_17645:188-1102(-)|eukprot:Cvel_25592.t1-p1 / transcript=Cvel_25592.t1 / gene=Cvel_25592 / organism=Chromera_velia_CCMP2878 / gene_product=hypothetical protein / transcript_product=hypothetical protein / location=Cvel_scaffold2920:5055-5966(+) / protein_length=304 / sequence_SO=supercontig / SO=protein_coding / is_pseudo=false